MAINQTAFPNIATPKLKKTSISLGGNFGGQSNLGNVSPINSKVSSASHIKSLKSQRRVLERVIEIEKDVTDLNTSCLLYTSPSPRDATLSRMPSSA